MKRTSIDDLLDNMTDAVSYYMLYSSGMGGLTPEQKEVFMYRLLEVAQKISILVREYDAKKESRKS